MKYSEFCEQFHLELNEQQETAVLSTEGAVLLLAVPGSGKTTTLVARLGYLIYCCDIAPENILTMTYTVAAAADMKARFSRFFGDEYADRMAFRTINGVCATIINRYIRETDARPFSLLEDNAKVIGDVFHRVYGEFADESDIKDCQSAVTYIKNMRLGRDGISKLRLGEREVAPLYDEYCAAMKQLRFMDYDDQMVIARSVLLKYPDILSRFRSRYRYLCVDEAQDTSLIQHEIIRILTGNEGSLFMVGDEDQSIYGFRAAYPDALMDFEKDHSPARVLYLEQNYRSTPEIVRAANNLIARNSSRRDKLMFTVRPSGAAVTTYLLDDRGDQYSYILNRAKKAQGSELAVLYRNNDSAVSLIDFLDRSGIPFRCRGAETLFFTNRTVLGLLDFLRFALEPSNEELFMRIYYKFGLKIKRTDAENAVSSVRAGKSADFILALAADPSVSSRKSSKLLELYGHFRAIRRDSAYKAVSRVRYNMGYGGYILQTSGDQERLFILTSLALREKTVEGFLAHLDALKEVVESGGDRESRLILSTIHSSKGLEYDSVILIDAIDGILPALPADSIDDPDPEELKLLEEERRLFYVAMTRAKNELCILTYRSSPSSVFIKQFSSPAAKPSEPVVPSREAPVFTPGMRVVHSAFGPGTVRKLSGDIIEVAFEKYGVRHLLLSACIKRDLLVPADI